MIDRRSGLCAALAVHRLLDSRSILILEKHCADIVDSYMDSIGHSNDGQCSLQTVEISSSSTSRRTIRTSVDPGSIVSLALIRAPLASWISLILLPPLPILRDAAISLIQFSCYFRAYTLPMREFGIMNLIVTAREPGRDGVSNGSSLILRTISPNA